MVGKYRLKVCKILTMVVPKLSRDAVVRVVSVILRVPSLFIAEAWYRTDPELAAKHHYTNALTQGRDLEGAEEIVIKGIYYSMLLLAVALIVLPLKKLVTFYMYIVSALLLCLSQYLSYKFIQTENAKEYVMILDDTNCVRKVGVHLILQCILGGTIAYLIDLTSWKRVVVLVYTIPLIGRILNMSAEHLLQGHNFASVFSMISVVGFIFNHIPIVLDLAKAGLNHASLAVQMYGWVPFILAMWLKMLLPMQMLVFWMTLFILQVYKYISVPAHPVVLEGWLVLLLASIGECCVTPVSLVGLCVTVSYISFSVLSFTRVFLQGAWVAEDNLNGGWTEGFTMFLLAMQTGLTELKSAQRAFLMSLVLFIVLSSLIQSVYEMTDPVLLQLAASQNKNVLKHVRAIALCTMLWLLPLYMTFIICQIFALDFWLLVVMSSCVLTSVRVIGSLVVYSLFMYDAARETPWTKLDDVVYYAKATTRVLEFLVALYVVLYGIWESIFGEWSWVNSSILIVHCYFNVWQRLQSGWRSYLMRREAVMKIAALPDATEEQLVQHADVCAICFQELNTAKITPCKHFYHALCLRKWLYVKEECPMCHQKIMITPSAEDDEAHNDEAPDESDAPEENITANTSQPSSQSHSNCTSSDPEASENEESPSNVPSYASQPSHSSN